MRERRGRRVPASWRHRRGSTDVIARRPSCHWLLRCHPFRWLHSHLYLTLFAHFPCQLTLVMCCCCCCLRQHVEGFVANIDYVDHDDAISVTNEKREELLQADASFVLESVCDSQYVSDSRDRSSAHWSHHPETGKKSTNYGSILIVTIFRKNVKLPWKFRSPMTSEMSVDVLTTLRSVVSTRIIYVCRSAPAARVLVIR